MGFSLFPLVLAKIRVKSTVKVVKKCSDCGLVLKLNHFVPDHDCRNFFWLIPTTKVNYTQNLLLQTNVAAGVLSTYVLEKYMT